MTKAQLSGIMRPAVEMSRVEISLRIPFAVDPNNDRAGCEIVQRTMSWMLVDANR